MAEAQRRQMKESSAPHHEAVSEEAARAAIQRIFPEYSYWHYDKKQTEDEFIFTARLKSFTNTGLIRNTINVKVVVSWPVGQGGHSLVKITLTDQDNREYGGTRYACWKNPTSGKAEVQEWSHLPYELLKSYHNLKNWHEHGVKWPRNRASFSRGLAICCYFLMPAGVAMFGFLLATGLALIFLSLWFSLQSLGLVNLLHDVPWLLLALVGGIPGAVIGAVLGERKFVNDMNDALHSAWSRWGIIKFATDEKSEEPMKANGAKVGHKTGS